jgi:hypothetical protein
MQIPLVKLLLCFSAWGPPLTAEELMQEEALLKAEVIKETGGPSLAELEARANHTSKDFLKLRSCTEGKILVRRQGNRGLPYC